MASEQKPYNFDMFKNITLIQNRGISFEEVIALIEDGNCLLEIIEHHNPKRYPGQKIYVIDISGYIYLVLFIENEKEIFLKTIFPSRKATKQFLAEKKESPE